MDTLPDTWDLSVFQALKHHGNNFCWEKAMKPGDSGGGETLLEGS